MPPKGVAEVQDRLYKSLGLDQGTAGPGPRGNRPAGRRPLSRKDERKAERAQKKARTYSRDSVRNGANGQPRLPSKAPATNRKPANAPKPILKKKTAATKDVSSEEDDGFDDDDDDDDEGGDDEGFDFSDDGSETESEDADQAESGVVPKISSTAQARLDQDDAEIAELERKLGIKGRKSLPKAFKDDGLDLILGDLDGGLNDGDDGSDGEEDSSKRKRDYDDWLASKRRKTTTQPYLAKKEGAGDMMEEDDDIPMGQDDDNSIGDDDEDGDDFDDDSADGDSFNGFDDEESQPEARQKENPYVAPTTGPVLGKYVPPSLRRKMEGGQGEAMDRLRKQCQGLINRLTDANILSIVQAAEEIYQKNARGDVTEVLTETILAQVCKPEALPDQFFVLMGGFAAAVYKIIGSSFGSHLIRRVVHDFGQEYDKASAVQADLSAIPKEPSNLLTFLSQLYVFEVVGCKILFDYMQRLLEDLTEINVELLLRICRNGGRQMRRDDPQALKNISGALSRAVSKRGYNTVSARTKFMVETIDNLKNNKAKGKGMDSSVVSEHVVRMKKRLGELKSQTRRLDGLTAMGVDLEDIIQADTRGKWWLVGASVPVKKEEPKQTGESEDKDADSDDMPSDTESEDMDFVLPDYPKKARAQGLAKPSQIATFIAIMKAHDADMGYRQYLNLKLRRDEKLEIARVLVQCVGSEVEYNPYYADVAERACSNNKVRFALQSRLWQIFRAMGEALFDEDGDDQDTADAMRFQDPARVRKVAQFYASLIAQGALRISILKPLNIPEMEPHTRIFLESLLIGLLQECKSKNPEKEDRKVEKAFAGARDFTQLSAGLDWFMKEKLRKTKALSSAKLKKLDGVKRKARAAIQGISPDDQD